MQRRSVERGGSGHVRSLGGKCQVTRALLVVVRDGSQARVRLATSPGRRVLVAGRREQGVGEAHPLGVELDDSGPGGLLEPVEDLRPLAVCGN